MITTAPITLCRWSILELVRIRAMLALKDGDSGTFRRASEIMRRAANRESNRA